MRHTLTRLALSLAATLFGTSAAGAWLLDLAPNVTQDRILTTALLAANAALGAEVADRLFSLARDGTLRAETRARVLRWLSEAGRREGKAAQADDLLRALAQDG